jgi:tRNA 2-thiouridine synthesizing protein A
MAVYSLYNMKLPCETWVEVATANADKALETDSSHGTAQSSMSLDFTSRIARVSKGETEMVKTIDARGLKCPHPTLMLMTESKTAAKGDVIEIVADCPTFEHDIRQFCNSKKKALLWIRVDGESKRCQVQM